jgi:sulfite exporter TauE/SafE
MTQTSDEERPLLQNVRQSDSEVQDSPTKPLVRRWLLIMVGILLIVMSLSLVLSSHSSSPVIQ